MDLLAYPSQAAEDRIRAVIGRGMEYGAEDYAAVSEIITEVKTRGDAALMDYTHRFDAPDMAAENLIVGDGEIEAAEKLVDGDFRKALARSAEQIESFHRRQVKNSWFDTPRPGVILGQMVNPVRAAGIYVPGAKGGMTPLVSSVLMGAIPARIAGVEQVAMVTPPMADGGINPHLLVAAKTVGIDVIYKVGSAWAVAGLAFGTQTMAPVDVIVGPGNIYVTLAKKILSGTVGIDMLAGPSEITVIADSRAESAHIAADLLSQAEHDALSSAILITDSKTLAESVAAALDRQLAALPRKAIAEQALANYGGILVVEDIDTAVALANRIAPEHLELQVTDPFALLGAIRNAGAIFMGAYTPEPVGDYMAGPNHVLPTGGTARFSSALSVDCFMKQSSLVYYTADAFGKEADDVIRLAETEGLGAHAASVKLRLTDKK
ncbi:MAG: histidinol dehydrogenase [Thermodesulfobacteriota bacterium]